MQIFAICTRGIGQSLAFHTTNYDLYEDRTYVDARVSWYTPWSGVIVDQATIETASVAPQVRNTEGGSIAAEERGALLISVYPTTTITINATTLGIQTIASNLGFVKLVYQHLNLLFVSEMAHQWRKRDPQNVTYDPLDEYAYREKSTILTIKEIRLITTIPAVSVRFGEIPARACPPTMTLRTRYPCIDITLRILGMAAP